MSEYVVIKYDAFRGINRKISPADLNNKEAVSVKNLKVTKVLGQLVRAPGAKIATLNGATFTRQGLGSVNINSFAELRVGAPVNRSYFIAQAGTDIYYWDESTAEWVKFPDVSIQSPTYIFSSPKSQYLQRINSLIIMTDDSLGVAEPIWVGYTNQGFQHAYSAPPKTVTPLDGALIAKYAKLDTPKANDWLSISTVSNSNWNETLQSGYYRYKIALQYDGFQWSAPSDDYVEVSITSPAHSLLKITVPSNYNKRITGFRIYRAGPGVGIDDTYYLKKEININDDLTNDEFGLSVVNNAATYSSAEKKFTMNATHNFADDEFNGELLGVRNSQFEEWEVGADDFDQILWITDTLSSGNGSLIVNDGGNCINGQTYYIINMAGWHYDGANYIYCFSDAEADLSTSPEMYSNLGYVEGENASLRYGLGIIVGNRQFVGRWHDGEGYETDKVRISTITPAGTYNYDVYHAEDMIVTDGYNISEITGFAKDRDRLVILGKEDILIVDLGTGEEFSYTIIETLQNVGLVAPHSVISIDGAIYYISTDGPRQYYNGVSKHLSQLEQQTNWPLGVTDLTEAISGYDPTGPEWIVAFPTDKKIYCYNTSANEWTEYEIPVGIQYAVTTSDKRLLITDGTNIYEITSEESKFNGSALIPYYESGDHSVSGLLIKPVSYEVRYNSDTPICVKLILDGLTQELPDQNLGAGQNHILNYFPVGLYGHNCRFVITLDDVYKDSNSQFSIDSFVITAKVSRK